MSSHREAPEISKDPVADNTDVYAFVSPERPDSITLIANFIPFQNPQGGPNFYEFGDDVLYEIHVSNRGSAQSDVTYQFQFRTEIRNATTFLYNTGPITAIDSPSWNRPQYYSVRRLERGKKAVTLAQDLTVPPVNVGSRSTGTLGTGKTYDELFTAAASHEIAGDRRVFAGQRADGFNVDLGSIFDLGVLRPFESLHLIPSAAAAGVNGVQGLNVHSIAIQVPITDLTFGHYRPTDVMDTHATVGVWATASRRRVKLYDYTNGQTHSSGNYRQVSRLGMPLFNEVITPMARKDFWNSQKPSDDSQFAPYVAHPELAALLPALYPGVFPNLAAYTNPRADLLAILLTGIPSGVVPGFQNYTGSTQADMLRLNVAVPPTAAPNPLGLVAGDPAGFPNGRRVIDDVVTVELRAIGGLTIPLVDPSYTPDGAASVVKDGTTNTNSAFLNNFPYLGTPAGGYQSTPGTPHT
jgi:Domain of unknown function (DUF4331)